MRIWRHFSRSVETLSKMETKSPYFSPKKTRNFTKKTATQGALLQKVLQKSKPTECQGKADATVPLDAIVPPATKAKRQRKPIRIESAVEQQQCVTIKVEPPEPEQIKQEIKSEPQEAAENDEMDGDVKQAKWEPINWRQTLANIQEMRKKTPAPVDTMGCDQFQNATETTAPRIKRFHCLVSLILSSQTKDQVNHDCMQRLKKHGLTPELIVATDDTTLEKLIYPVSFFKNKTKFIKSASQILIDQYDGDIPATIEEMLKLPGVGKKVAHLCMRSAWNVVTGIGVDTHVHRISNWLRWVPRETKTPEDTRVALERWLPFELWNDVNKLLVGFGQTICTSTYPRCNECLNAPICPARGKYGIRRSPIKKEIKSEDLEF